MRISSTCSHHGSIAVSWSCGESTGRHPQAFWKKSSATKRSTKFAAGLNQERANESSAVLKTEDRAALANLDIEGWWQTPPTREPVEEPLMRAAAWYFLHARNRNGVPLDAVARFHLGNGARLEQLHWLGDGSGKGIAQAHGVMVNYLYDLEDIEKNHEAYAENRTIVPSSAVKRLARSVPMELVPTAS